MLITAVFAKEPKKAKTIFQKRTKKVEKSKRYN